MTTATPSLSAISRRRQLEAHVVESRYRRAKRDKEWFILGCPERPGEESDEPLRDVLLKRLRLPMEVYSSRAGRWITLPSLHLVYRWAAREFYQYEVGSL